MMFMFLFFVGKKNYRALWPCMARILEPNWNSSSYMLWRQNNIRLYHILTYFWLIFEIYLFFYFIFFFYREKKEQSGWLRHPILFPFLNYSLNYYIMRLISSPHHIMLIPWLETALLLLLLYCFIFFSFFFNSFFFCFIVH